MLSELRIENFAIIDHLEVTFHPGLVILTGETGAGKSIIIDAVEAVLGNRADTTLIREGAERATVEAVFTIHPAVREPLQTTLEAEGLLDDPGVVVVGREIRRGSRNISRINGRSVSNSLLKWVSEYLVDVHGQSEHLSLLRVPNHLRLLDSYAGLEGESADYTRTFKRLQGIRRDLNDLRQAESEAARRMDMLNYQINEIKAAKLIMGEEEELRAERNRLANAENLASLAQQLIQSLDDGAPETPAVTELLGEIVTILQNLSRLDPSQTSIADQSQVVLENLNDIVLNLRNYLDQIEFNPRRLDQVEERLNLIQNMKRKYGGMPSATIADVLAYYEKAQHQLEEVTHTGERIEQLEEEEAGMLDQLRLQGNALSHARRTASKNLERSVESELADLSMDGARFQVDFQQHDRPDGILLEDGRRVAFDSTGLERVEFLVAPNPGEGFKPLVKIASGGETSRLMLAIKNVLAKADQVPTLIFDEIDQGIGGRVGTVVGRKLWELARRHQVLCVTHLPQLAAFGEQHLRVQKALSEGRTLTRVDLMSGDERLLELAQMMGEIGEGTRRSAQELLQIAAETTAV